MIIDVVVLCFLLVFAVLGWKSGLGRQLVHWVALAAASALSFPLGAALVPLLEPQLAGHRYWVIPTVALLLAWLLLFLFFNFAAVMLHRLLRSTREGGLVKSTDRVLGVLFSCLKGAVILLFLATGLYLLRTPFSTAFPALKPVIANSATMQVIEEYNPLVNSIKEWRRGIQSQRPPIG